MMAIFLMMHFGLFSRHENYERFKRWGAIFSVIVALEIAFSLINFILIGVSICNDGAMAVAGILSSLAILIINSCVLVGSILYFLGKTRVATAQVAVEEKRPLANNRGGNQTDDSANQSQRPPIAKEEKVEDVDEPPPAPAQDDDDYGIE